MSRVDNLLVKKTVDLERGSH